MHGAALAAAVAAAVASAAVASALAPAAIALTTSALAAAAISITSASRTMVIAVFNWILSQLGFRARRPWYSQCSRRLGRGWD